MHRFNGFDIELTKGDSVQFKVTITGRTLPSGTVALFTVKKKPRDDEPVLEKKLLLNSDGTVMVGITSEESNVTPRTYYWDMRVMIPTGDGRYEVRTPMEYAAFTIMEVVGNV